MKFFTDANGIKCWVCGEDAKPYNTNPFDPNRPRCSKKMKTSAIIFFLQKFRFYLWQFRFQKLHYFDKFLEHFSFDSGSKSWCSNMVTSSACQGDGVLCYKEIWNVDGTTSNYLS